MRCSAKIRCLLNLLILSHLHKNIECLEWNVSSTLFALSYTLTRCNIASELRLLKVVEL